MNEFWRRILLALLELVLNRKVKDAELAKLLAEAKQRVSEEDAHG